MPAALECITGFSTAPGSTVTALTADSNQSFTVKNSDLRSDIRLLSLWGYNNAAGILRVRSPKLHDFQQGIRHQVIATAADPMLPRLPLQRLWPQDTLTVENTGSSTAGQLELGFLLLYYADLPGASARFIDVDALNARAVDITGVEVDITAGVAGGWSGAAAINATFDNWIANTDYALVGWTVSAAVGGIAIQGPDTSNLKIGGPGQSGRAWATQDWFTSLTRFAGIPLIPVINSANKAATTLAVANNQAALSPHVSLSFVRLAPGGAPSPTASPYRAG